MHATYEYYLHGPVKRVMLATDLQGIDYTYTVQGWLKAINHPVRAYDPGGDGSNEFPEDAFAMSLDYFEGDYARQNTQIGSMNMDETIFEEQFNGNIRAMTFGTGSTSQFSATYKPVAIYNNPQILQFSAPLIAPLTAYAEEFVLLPNFDSNGQEINLIVQQDQVASVQEVQIDDAEVVAYKYDSKYQLTDADYSSDGGGTYGNDYNVAVKSDDATKGPYDANGNIQGIKRYDNDATALRDDFEFTYESGTNKLIAVSNYITGIGYNAIGQVTSIDYFDAAKTDISVAYDVTGKVTRVANLATDETLVEFSFDDRGFRIMKRVGTVEQWYVRDASGQVLAIYNKTVGGTTISQIELPIYGAGKLGMAFKNPDHYKYIYELTDHLGSVRALATKLGLQATASMEEDAGPNGIDEYEEQYFDNLDAVRQTDVNNSRSGTRFALTNPSEPIGPTTTLTVKAGDEIFLEAFAKYVLPGGFDPGALTGGISGLLTGGVNSSAVGVEGSGLVDGIGNNLGTVLGAIAGTSGEPKAYLQYILLDENFAMVSNDYTAVTGNFSTLPEDNGYEQLTLSTTVAQDGYLYAYVVNESTENVNFDDFTFSIQGPRVIRKTDYYPFGAVAKRWNNPDQTQQEKYRHGYQGQYSEADSTTGWNAFELRMYDPLIGRWLQVDPARQYASPYLSMGNNPMSRIDPDGGTDIYTIKHDGSIERQITGSIDYFFYEDADGNTTLLGSFERNDFGMIELPGSFSFNNGDISFGIAAKQNGENFISPVSLAALLGVGVETGFTDITVTAYSLFNGNQTEKHKTHEGGINGDLRLLSQDADGSRVLTSDYNIDRKRNNELIAAFRKFGYGSVLSMHLWDTNLMLDGTTEHAGHHNHLHLQKFKWRNQPIPTVPYKGLMSNQWKY